MQRFMDTGLTRLTYKTAYYGSQWHKAVLLTVLCPSSEFVNLWMCLRIMVSLLYYPIASPLAGCCNSHIQLHGPFHQFFHYS
jgi:hypothetical protein